MKTAAARSGCAGMTSTDVETMFDRAGKRLRGVERGKMLSASGLSCTAYMREARKFVSG